MRIAIPVEDTNISGKVCPSFGRAPYFMVYDTNGEQAEFIENTAANSPGGAGVKAAQIVVDQNIDALLTPRCGQNSADVMKTAGIEFFQTVGDSISNNIEAYKNNTLLELKEIHEGFHNHVGK
jgi:predicted Fe-Mo cluster-binding NifX family protein